MESCRMFFYPLRCSCTLCRSIQVLMKLFFFLYYQLSWALDTIMPLKCGTFSIKNISSIYMKLRCHIHLTIKFSFWTYFKNKFWYFNHLIYCVVHLQHLKDSFKENFLFCINILLTLLPVRYLFSLYALMFFVCKITVFSDSVYKDTNFWTILFPCRFAGRMWFIGCGPFSQKIGDRGEMTTYIWVHVPLLLVFPLLFFLFFFLFI
jgi:hypothetical protein